MILSSEGLNITSILRFAARPSTELFGAIGKYSLRPAAVMFCGKIWSFSKSISTTAVALLVYKSQLDFIAPLLVKGTLSVWPSIKIEISGFFINTIDSCWIAFFP